MLRGLSRRNISAVSTTRRIEEKHRRRKMFFESLENRAMMAVFEWSGGGGDGLWSNAANWMLSSGVDADSDNIPASNGDSVLFSGMAPGAIEVDIPVTINDVHFTAGDYTLNNGALDVTMGNNIEQDAGTNVINSVLIGDGGVVVNGGALTLSGANSYAGTTQVDGGVLNIVATPTSNPLGSSAVVLNGGVLDVDSAAAPVINALGHVGYHINSETITLDLTNNSGVISHGDPTTFSNFEGLGLLTSGPIDGSNPTGRGLDFNGDADFRAVPASLKDDASGDGKVIDQNDNYTNLFIGTFTPDISGNWGFKQDDNDDRGAIWIDTDQDGVFESSPPGRGDNRGEQMSYESTTERTRALVAGQKYLIAVLHSEGTGGSTIDINVRRPGGGLTPIKPTNPAQAGFWSFTDQSNVTLGNSVTVNANSTLSADGAVTFGALTINAAATELDVVSNHAAGTLPARINFSGVTTLDGGKILDHANQVALRLGGVVQNGGSAGGVNKTGNGTLVLGANNSFTGDVTVTGGVVALGNNGGLGNETTGKTTVNGGTLDIRGFRAGTTGNELVEIAGTGVNGFGAVVNSGAAQQNAFRRLNLIANATLRSDNRIDVRNNGGAATFNMGGFTLTKVGTAEFAVVSSTIANPGSVNANQGLFRLEGSTDFDGTGTVSVANAATFNIYNNTQNHAVNVTLAAGSNLTTTNGGGPTLGGTLTLNGVANLTVSNNLTVNGRVTGAGGFNKTGTAALTLNNNTNDYASVTSVSNGVVVVPVANALGGVGQGTFVSGSGAVRYIGPLTAAPEPLYLTGAGNASSGALQSQTDDVTLSGAIRMLGNTFIGNNTSSGTLRLNGPIGRAADANVQLMGSGSFDIAGEISDKGYSLSPITARVYTGVQQNIADATIISNDINEVTPAARTTTLNGPLTFANAAAFNAFFSPAITLTDNFTTVFETTLTVTTPGEYSFAVTNNDDGGAVWLKPAANANFVTGDRLQGIVSGNNTSVATRNLAAGTYTLVYAHREGTGGEAVTGRIAGPGAAGVTNGTLLPVVNPSTSANSNHLIKTGTGTATLSGANSYAGVTLVHQGVLEAASDDALGALALVSGIVPIGVFAQQWQVGTDNGNQSEFSAESGSSNAAPGSATARDDDWYFAGTYPAPIGVVATTELVGGGPATGFERALTAGDPTNRIHFNVAANQLSDNFNLVIDTIASSFTGGSITLNVLVNGVNVHSSVRTSNGTITTATFNGAAVGLTIGDNVVTLTRTGGGAHLQFDYIRLNRQAAIHAADTQVQSGATLAISGGITSAESLVATGTGAAGQPGAITSPGGANSVTGTVTLPANVSVDVAGGAELAFTNTVQGAADLTKTGGGVLALGGMNTYSGETFVNAGELLVNGTNSGLGDVTVNNAAVLGGTGTIAGAVTLNNTSTLAPGTSVESLDVASIAWNMGTTFEVEIDGDAGAGMASGHDILNVDSTGSVDLGGATLDLVLGYTPSFGQTFTIIDNASAAPVTNTFSGLDEGEVFSVTTGPNSALFQITYLGGDGNDVVLTVLDPANPALAGTPDDDTIDATHNGTNVDITLNGNLIFTIVANEPFSIDGLTGNDVLTLDYALGVFGPVTFDGNEGGEEIGVGDALFVQGNSFATLDYDATGDGAGVLTFTGASAVVNFSNLEPVTVSSLLGAVTIDIDPLNAVMGANTATLTDAAGPNMTITLSAPFESMTFSTPTNGLTINGDNSDSDTVTIASVDNDLPFRGPLTINGLGGGADVVNLDAALTLGAGAVTGNLNVTAERINLNAGVATGAGTTAGDISLNGSIVVGVSVALNTSSATSAGGAVTLNGEISASGTGRDLSLNSSSTLAAAAGGAVSLGVFDSTIGGDFVNDLTINTTPGSGGVAGSTTLNGSIQLDNNGVGAADPSSFVITGNGNIVLTASIVVDTESGTNTATSDGNGGFVNWNLSQASGDAPGRDLTINTRGATAGGVITLGAFGNANGAFINDLTLDTTRHNLTVAGTVGQINLQGDILLDNDGADAARFILFGNGGSGAPAASSRVAIVGPAGTLRRIDTEQGNDGAGGDVLMVNASGFSSTGLISVSGSAAGIDLEIDTSTTAAGLRGGAIGLPNLTNTGGSYLNDISLHTGGGSPALGGTIRFISLLLDNNGADAADVNITGNGVILVERSGNQIDTENGNNGPGGSVNFGTSPLSGQGANFDFSINTLTTAAGQSSGSITLGPVNNAAGQLPTGTPIGGSFLNDLSLNATPGAGGAAGTVTLNGNISLDNNGTGDSALLNITGGGNIVLGVPAAATLTIDTEQANSAGVTSVGGVSFGTSAVSALNAGVNLTILTSTVNGTSVGGNVTLAGLNAAAGNLVNNLLIDANAAGTAARGTVALNTAAIGLAGTLTVSNSQSITQAAAAPITTAGAISMNARNAVTLNANVNAGASTVTISANQDATGAEGFTQASGTSILTTNATAAAISVRVNTASGGTGSAAIAGLQAGAAPSRVTVNTTGSGAAGGAITDANVAVLNATAGELLLLSATGVGSAVDPLETTVSNLEGAGGTGGFFVANAGDLTIGNIGATIGVSATGGDVVVTTTGALVVAENVTATGAGVDVTLTAIDAMAAGQNLTVNGGVTVSSAAATVTLNAGDDATITGNVTAGGNAFIVVDFGDAESNGVDELVAGTGGVLTIGGVITTSGGAGTTFLSGNDDFDTFNFDPQTTTAFSVNGNPPTGTMAGDTLIITVPALTVQTVTDVGSGGFSFAPTMNPNLDPVTYTSIESQVVTGGPLNLVIDLVPIYNGAANQLMVERVGADLVITRTGTGPNIGNFYTGTHATINSLTVSGGANNDTVEVRDSSAGLPDFTGTVPSVTDNGNVMDTAEFLFTGGLGDNQLNFVLNSAGTAQTYGIGDGSGTASLSGEILTSNTAGPNSLSTFFTGVSEVNRTGTAAGGLTVLGDSSPNNITISDNSLLMMMNETRVAAENYTPFDFSGDNYSELTVSGLGGDDIIVLASFGGGQTNDSPVLLQGDGGADVIQVQSTSGETGELTLVGGTENDTFYLSDGALPGSPQTAPDSAFNTGDVDDIAAVVTVFGEGNPAVANELIAVRNNRLFVTDEASGMGNTVGITETAINDILGVTAGPDIGYSNIDTLAVTGSDFVDTLDAVFNVGSDLTTVTINGASGDDLLLLDLNSLDLAMNAVFDAQNGPLASVNLNGDAGDDIIGEKPMSDVPGFQPPANINMLRPSTTTVITINGGAPGPNMLPGDGPGDVLNLDVTQIPTALTRNLAGMIVSTTPGEVIAAGYQDFTFTSIEDINLMVNGEISTVQMGDLFLRGTQENDLIQFANAANSGDPLRTRLRFNAQPFFYFSLSGKTVTYGADGIDNITQSNVNRPAHFFGEGGNDVLAGALQGDLLVGGPGNDRINGGEGNNIIWGDNNPTTDDLNPQDFTRDGDGNDQLSGGAGNDIFYGGGGNDSVSAGKGDDYAYGGEGNDSLTGAEGNDRLYGGEGDDTLSGVAGDDLLSGGDGKDKLLGNIGADVLIGGDGADTIDGGTGTTNDLLVSGIVAGETASVAFNDTAVTMLNPGSGAADAALLMLLDDWVTSNDRSDLDGMVMQDMAVDTLTGGAGADDLSFTTGLDKVIGFLVGADEQF